MKSKYTILCAFIFVLMCFPSFSQIKTNPVPTSTLAVTVSGPAYVCNGSPAMLCAAASGGIGAYTYSWAPGSGTSSCTTAYPSTNTTYTVMVEDSTGASVSSSITVVVPPGLNVSTYGPTSICSGAAASLCVGVTGGTAPYTYLWQPGGATTQCITESPPVTTTYTVSITDVYGCSTNHATETVNVNPSIDIIISCYPTEGCAPLCVQFRNLSTIGSGHIAYTRWTFGTGDTSYADNPLYCYANSGSYYVTLTETSDSGCSASIYVPNLVTVFDKLKAAFTPSPQTTSISSPTIQFTNNSTDADSIVSVQWDFGDGFYSTLPNPSHTYQDTGTFCVTLYDVNIHGCDDYATNCINVVENVPPVVSLYPTISDGNFTIKWFVGITPAPIANIIIANELGQEVYTGQITSITGYNTAQFNLENLASATYFLRANIGGSVSVNKFVVMHNK